MTLTELLVMGMPGVSGLPEEELDSELLITSKSCKSIFQNEDGWLPVNQSTTQQAKYVSDIRKSVSESPFLDEWVI